MKERLQVFFCNRFVTFLMKRNFVPEMMSCMVHVQLEISKWMQHKHTGKYIAGK